MKVYHSSTIRDIKIFKPTISSHGKAYVYACKDPVMSALFLSGIGGDFTCKVGRDPETNQVFLCERFQGAIELRYKNKKGSLYTLSNESFLENKTPWQEEVVSEKALVPLEEIYIDDAKTYLKSLEKKGLLKIYEYPNRPSSMHDGDEDLIMRGVKWTRVHGQRILDQIKRYHPHLLDKVLNALEKDLYL